MSHDSETWINQQAEQYEYIDCQNWRDEYYYINPCDQQNKSWKSPGINRIATFLDKKRKDTEPEQL